MTAEEIARRRAESHERMQQGIALLESGRPAEALPHFDRAIELREAWPWREDGELAWMLAAAWINRADALRESSPDEALHALDRGIAIMAHVPLERHPALPDRLILAWIKRADLDGDAASYDEAARLLDRWGHAATPERAKLAAMLPANRARTLLDRGEIPAALEHARDAVKRHRDLERLGFPGTDGITARAVLCRALAMELDFPGGPPERDWIAEATDAVEEALTLAKAGILHPTLPDLVRYGAKIYRTCQPQFLGEYLVDWLAGRGPLADDETLGREMRNELLLARAEAERKILLVPHETAFVERQAKVLESLRRAEARLA